MTVRAKWSQVDQIENMTVNSTNSSILTARSPMLKNLAVLPFPTHENRDRLGSETDLFMGFFPTIKLPVDQVVFSASQTHVQTPGTHRARAPHHSSFLFATR